MGQSSNSTTKRLDQNEEKDKARWGTQWARLRLVVVNLVGEANMGRYILLWLLGIPIPILVLIWLFGGLH
jgi:hypothetical protein